MNSKLDQQQAPPLPTHFIGIGASAGGLEALQILLKNLPTDTGACFVIVQHLSPDFKSMMLELLSKHTLMTIENVKDGVLAKPNTIYLLPPKKNMIIAQGELLLADKVPDSGLNLPIDVFFRSLSEDQQHRAIGIILSGTGSDGSRGVKALKEAGALVIAQQPDSAKFDGMPNSAINTGIVDFILRPEDMGKQLAKYIQHPLVSGKSGTLRDDMEYSQDVMREIFDLLKLKSDIDFSKYKPSTIARRIERRMAIKHVSTLREYLSMLFKDSYEVTTLSKELLIGVTRFFRDSAAFEIIEKEVVPKLVEKSKLDQPIRIWVAACSSGEEAYSISMLVHKEINKQDKKRTVKIFATDVNPDAIAEAGIGSYSPEISHDISPDLLAEYFNIMPDGNYQINKSIRHSVVFATHNMIIDPPFSNLDLVTCRNALIYFQHSAQKRVLASFHFALKKHGFLFLGSSENLGDLGSYFETLNERNKIYQKTSDLKVPISANTELTTKQPKSPAKIPAVSHLMKNYRGNGMGNSGINFASEALITHYLPPCILLNDDQQALHVYGDTSPFIKRLPPGRISNQITDMVNDDISIAIASALQRAKKSKKEVFYKDMQTLSNDSVVQMNMRVRYVQEHDINESPGYFWIVFETIDRDPNDIVEAVQFDANEQSKQRIEDLELELSYNKEHLQVTVEELETTNEELQSTNEELMSSNEELQSTNEELQSVNEELYTVNSEYQEKIAEISQANGDLDEVLNLSKIGIIFLDEDFLIRRFTNAVQNYINVMHTDINRPFHHITKNFEYDNLHDDVARVFQSGETMESEITLEDKRLLRITINAYSYNDLSESKGVALTFSDISRVKYMELGMLVAYKKLRKSVNNALDMLDQNPFNQNLGVLIVDDNAAYLEMLRDTISAISSYKTNIFSAQNIDQALQHVAEQKIDVCIADYNLDDETAIDFLSHLNEAAINIPVIVITADMHEQLNPILLSHGVLDLIEKENMSPTAIDKSIRYAIRRHQIDADIEALITKRG